MSSACCSAALNSSLVAWKLSLLKITRRLVSPWLKVFWMSAEACCDGALGSLKPALSTLARYGVATTLTPNITTQMAITIQRKR